ncbi:hypothetical protein [Salinivibrio socompensis]|uniref:hypothetical protein n=1 Tax=Salinivibrio socompensis TaxID=1510206 RepID=UPI0004B538C4|nr:hypothetical protein [Salinivibrio socompensis]
MAWGLPHSRRIYSIKREQEAIGKELHKDVNNAAMALAREVNLGLELLYAVKNTLMPGDRLNARNFHAFSPLGY